jgi:hypothetical protein
MLSAKYSLVDRISLGGGARLSRGEGMRFPVTRKVRGLHREGPSDPQRGGRGSEERRLEAELAALNALFEAAAMGKEGETFARIIPVVGGRGRRR